MGTAKQWAELAGFTSKPKDKPSSSKSLQDGQTQKYKDVFDFLIKQQRLPALVKALDSSIHDLLSLALVNKALWGELAGDHKLWRAVYLDNDPLVTPEIRKRMLREYYTRSLSSITHTLPRSGLQHSAWLRCCTLLHSKPRLVLLFAGRDPVILRRLGEAEDDAITLNLGLNYHLDSYLDEDSRRFAAEFPQVFQDLDAGDLVVTQDFKGAGLYAAVADPETRPFMQLKKCGRDSAGFGILGKDQAPPMFPLLYYCDASLEEVAEMGRKQLLARQVYWFSYTMLADKSMFNWTTLEVLESL